MNALYRLVSDFDRKNHAECICYEDRIILKTYSDGGFFQYFEDKERTIFLNDIASVTISKGRSSGSFLDGEGVSYIQFHVKGISEKSVDELLDSKNMKLNELIDNNAMFFTPKHKDVLLDKAYQIKEYVERQLASNKQPNDLFPGNQTSSNDPYHEILKFKGLCEKGIITEDEFFSAIKMILRM